MRSASACCCCSGEHPGRHASPPCAQGTIVGRPIRTNARHLRPIRRRMIQVTRMRELMTKEVVEHLRRLEQAAEIQIDHAPRRARPPARPLSAPPQTVVAIPARVRPRGESWRGHLLGSSEHPPPQGASHRFGMHFPPPLEKPGLHLAQTRPPRGAYVEQAPPFTDRCKIDLGRRSGRGRRSQRADPREAGDHPCAMSLDEGCDGRLTKPVRHHELDPSVEEDPHRQPPSTRTVSTRP